MTRKEAAMQTPIQSPQISEEEFDGAKVADELDKGIQAFVIAIGADNSLTIYYTPGNGLITPNYRPEDRKYTELEMMISTGHCGSMTMADGTIKECKWGYVAGQLKCRRCSNSWNTVEGC